MIKLSDILHSLIVSLKNEFSNIKVDSKDLTEEFERPSFRLELDNIKSENFNNSYKRRSLTIRIHYFTSKEKSTRLEKINIIDKLDFLLRPYISIGGKFIIPIDEIDYEEIENGVIIASFDINTVEEIIDDTDDSEIMEDLNININKGGIK